MLFWLREVAGWSLVIGSMFLISLGIERISSTQIVESAVIMFTAMSVMRMGILLIRVSTAARICLKEVPPKRNS